MLLECVDMVAFGLRRPNAGRTDRIASAAKADGLGDRDTRICIQIPRDAYESKPWVFFFVSSEHSFVKIGKPLPQCERARPKKKVRALFHSGGRNELSTVFH